VVGHILLSTPSLLTELARHLELNLIRAHLALSARAPAGVTSGDELAEVLCFQGLAGRGDLARILQPELLEPRAWESPAEQPDGQDEYGETAEEHGDERIHGSSLPARLARAAECATPAPAVVLSLVPQSPLGVAGTGGGVISTV